MLVVLFDTLRADHTEPYGATDVQTPNIARLAREGTTFLNAYSTSSWTRPSVASFFTSTNVSYHRTQTPQDILPSDLPYLPQLLRQNGYRTACISFNEQVASRWGFGRGFDFVYELAGARPELLSEHASAEAYAGHVWDTFIEPNVTEGDRPFFVYLHELDPHAPYEPLPPYDAMYPTAYRGWTDVAGQNIHLTRAHFTHLDNADYQYLNARYRGEVSFMDAYLGVLLERLE